MMRTMARDLVLLHGFTNTGASWDPVVAALAESYRALAPDIRGHGARPAQPVSLEAVIADLAALEPAAIHARGVFDGGEDRAPRRTRARLAGRVEQLVLIGASPGPADPATRGAPGGRRPARRRGRADEIEEFARRWAQTRCSRGSRRRWRRRFTPTGCAINRLGLPARSGGSARGAPIAVGPAMRGSGADELIAGERDAKFMAIATRWQRRCRRAESPSFPAPVTPCTWRRRSPSRI